MVGCGAQLSAFFNFFSFALQLLPSYLLSISLDVRKGKPFVKGKTPSQSL
jgi:hypothetical protein